MVQNVKSHRPSIGSLNWAVIEHLRDVLQILLFFTLVPAIFTTMYSTDYDPLMMYVTSQKGQTRSKSVSI